MGFYRAYRCGFAHGCPTLEYKWGRNGPGKYWYQLDGEPSLNIDQFVTGFIDGLAEFKRKALDTDLETEFLRQITLDAPRKSPRK